MNANKTAIMGDDLFLYIVDESGTTKQVIAFASSCELSIEGETVDMSNKMSCRWQANKRGNNSYSISSDSLYTQIASDGASFDDLFKKMVKGDAITWYIGSPKAMAEDETCEDRNFELDETLRYYTGEAIITSLSLSASTGEIASCSLSLTGSGEIKQGGSAPTA